MARDDQPDLKPDASGPDPAQTTPPQGSSPEGASGVGGGTPDGATDDDAVSIWDDLDPASDPFDPWYREAPAPTQKVETAEPADEAIRPGDISGFLSGQYDNGAAPPPAPAVAQEPEPPAEERNSDPPAESPRPDDATDSVQPQAPPQPEPSASQTAPAVEAGAPADEQPEHAGDCAQDDLPDADTPSHGPEPFFPIPDELPPMPPSEETAEVVRRPRRRPRAPRAPSGPVAALVNIFLWGIVVLVLLGLSVVALYGKYARDRLYGEQLEIERAVVLTVNQGDRLPQIIEGLREKRLLRSYMGIDDAYLMRLLARMNENSHLIKAGVYKFNTTMNLNDIYEKLVKGSQDFRITIPEGKAIPEVAQILKQKIEEFDAVRFVELTRNPSFIQTLKLNVPSLEGYLYPSTYFFGPGMREEDILRKMVETFQAAAKEHLEGIEKNDDLTFQEHLIMASLIEREARLDEDRPLIASVIFNRLEKKMLLQIDATVHFALNDWSRRLTLDDLKVESPYNTYQVKGLPPGPICSPRIASLTATFSPPKTDYLYYVLKGDGKHVFSVTHDEHVKNKQFFRRSQQEAAQAAAAAADRTTTDAAAKAPAVEAASGSGRNAKPAGKPKKD